MNRPIEEMTDRELLAEPVTESRRSVRIRKIRTGLRLALLAAVLVLACVYLPPAVRYARDVKAAVDRVNTVTEQVSAVAEEAQDYLDTLEERTDGLLSEAEDTVGQVRQQLDDLQEQYGDQLDRFREALDRLGALIPDWLR